MKVRPLREDERVWLRAQVVERWDADLVLGRGKIWTPSELDAVVAVDDAGVHVGFAVYDLTEDPAELVAMASLVDGDAVALVLVRAVADACRAAGAGRLRVLVTNDHLDALRLYQQSGFRLVELRPGVVDAAREVKPIPDVGIDGIPIRDELDLVLDL